MKTCLKFLAFILMATAVTSAAENLPTKVSILSEPLAGGRIEPTLFGNFMELLDDVVPGSWAELLNNRSFAGSNSGG